MICGRAHNIFSGMAEICVELVGVNFLRHNCFGCCLFLPSLLDIRLIFLQASSYWGPKEQHFFLLYNLVFSRNPSPDLFVIFLSKRILVKLFLSIRASPSDVTWKPYCSTRVTLNIFANRRSITAVFDNVTQCIFLSRF